MVGLACEIHALYICSNVFAVLDAAENEFHQVVLNLQDTSQLRNDAEKDPNILLHPEIDVLVLKLAPMSHGVSLGMEVFKCSRSYEQDRATMVRLFSTKKPVDPKVQACEAVGKDVEESVRALEDFEIRHMHLCKNTQSTNRNNPATVGQTKICYIWLRSLPEKGLETCAALNWEYEGCGAGFLRRRQLKDHEAFSCTYYSDDNQQVQHLNVYEYIKLANPISSPSCGTIMLDLANLEWSKRARMQEREKAKLNGDSKALVAESHSRPN
ncbi:hypothetical protein F52700_9023 [Fusarium sp. NRRL 52700]|nr:hypothetical protein F52700_9023 [Fusarium sp. NRRL 52700]